MTQAQQPDDCEPAIRLSAVRKNFGAVVAVAPLDLTIRRGEFFSLLGPSGCGKTTTLRMLAGFEFPDSGTIQLHGRDVTYVPPNRRPLNLVFQRYELFPHMTVRQNVGYGLRVKKVKKREIAERVGQMLEVVGVGDLGDRRADALSGGQQQRVALARALVNRPEVLLLDEPLSALDVKLRKHMQIELKLIQQELGTTFVYVTHDQEEAMALSDRMAIMNEGHLLQVGTPSDIYRSPKDDFVAGFVGTSNIFDLQITGSDGSTSWMDGADRRIVMTGGRPLGSELRASVRPERLLVRPVDDPAVTAVSDQVSALEGTIVESVDLGPWLQHVVKTPLGQVLGLESSAGAPHLRPGTQVRVTWPLDALLVLAEPAKARTATADSEVAAAGVDG